MKEWIIKVVRKFIKFYELEREVEELKEKVKYLENDLKYVHDLTNLVHIGVDVHFKEPSMILIYSKLNGGSIHHISADFHDPRELRNLVNELKQRFRTDKVVYDLPQHLKGGSFW